MESPTSAPTGDEVILEVQGLKKRFGAHEVLRGIDLTVTRADVFVIIGPNGCGKSTFLRCLNLLENYQEGRVLLRGQEVSAGRPDGHHPGAAERRQAQQLRQKIGMVFQQFNLFPHMNVLHNVMCGPLHVLKKPRAEAESIAEQMLRKVGLWDKHPCDPLTLSGGQQQRVAIARALAMSPDLVLFDEATSALDPVLTQEVFRVIKGLAQDGMTMILITHDMDFARDIADRVIFMEKGQIAAQGEPCYIFDHRPSASIQAFLSPR
jgi:ABC-type polar amino acid transport system ATPase subunit